MIKEVGFNFSRWSKRAGLCFQQLGKIYYHQIELEKNLQEIPKQKFLVVGQYISTELYIATRKNAFDTAKVLNTSKIQQYAGFFVIAGLRPMSDPRISDPQCGTIRQTGINFKSK